VVTLHPLRARRSFGSEWTICDNSTTRATVGLWPLRYSGEAIAFESAVVASSRVRRVSGSRARAATVAASFPRFVSSSQSRSRGFAAVIFQTRAICVLYSASEP